MQIVITKKHDKGVGTMGSVNAASSTTYKEVMKPDQTRTDILMLAENDLLHHTVIDSNTTEH